MACVRDAASCQVALVAWPATRRSRTCGPSWRNSRDCGRNCGRVRPRPRSCGTGSPGWSGSSRVTAATPRCRRRGMTPRAASRPAGSAARRSGRTRKSASGASSPARRGRRCAGRSRTTPVTTTRKGLAGAVRTWPARPTWGWPGRSSSWRSPSRPRSGSSMTCMRRFAAAGGTTWRPAAGVPDSPVSIGPNLRALAVYLLVFQHVG